MKNEHVMLITGTRKGIGKYLVGHYLKKGFRVIGCSRGDSDCNLEGYEHVCLDVADENAVKKLFRHIRKTYGSLNILINNAGIASMNHTFLTPKNTVEKILNTNIIGSFLFCREAGKLMRNNSYARIINFVTVAVPMKLEGEAVYAASKAAVVTLTQILSKEFGHMNITVNAVGPTPIKTDLILSVPEQKLNDLINRQAIKRFAEFKDISNVTDFFINPESGFITGQVIYLGGV